MKLFLFFLWHVNMWCVCMHVCVFTCVCVYMCVDSMHVLYGGSILTASALLDFSLHIEA